MPFGALVFLWQWWRQIALVIAVIAIAWCAHWLYQRGADSATIAITNANNKAESAADAAERCVLAGKWNKEDGKCQP